LKFPVRGRQRQDLFLVSQEITVRGNRLSCPGQRPFVISLSRLPFHQTPIERERGEDGKFRDSSLKKELPDFVPQILEVDPHRTNHGATIAIGAKIDALFKIPDFTFLERSTRSQSLDGGELFGGKYIDVRNPFKSDRNRAAGGTHSTMGARIQFHQLNHGQILSHPALRKTPGVKKNLEPLLDSAEKSWLHFSPPAALIKSTRGLTRIWNILLKGR
jgi:hypothetical protein